MQRPQGVLRLHRDKYQQLSSRLEHPSGQNSKATAADASPEHVELIASADPDRTAPCQLLLSRNGVGKTTLVNHFLMLGEHDVAISRDQAPKRYEQTENDRVLVSVSEAVAEVLGENDVLCSSGNIQYICNGGADMDFDHHEQEEAEQTFKPIREFVRVGPPEAHMQTRSFLLTTGCQTGTTTNSALQVQHGYVPGAVEKFKSRQQLQEDAFKYVQLADSDNPNQEQSRKLYERYKLITGLTNSEALPKTASEVPVCRKLEDVAGKTRLYSGHHESILTFKCFLRGKLTANQPFSPIHVALDSTTVYWPSSSVVVPVIDTPGTGDGNIINEATTQAAVDEAIQNGSQLLICGTKSLAAEATLAPFVVQYMQFMIVSSQDTPCIRGGLLPETSGQRYTHRTVCSEHEELTRQEKICASLEQLRKWMQQANEQLPPHQRAQPDRLSALLQRCEVRVAYLQLYASLCLQSHNSLRQLAFEAGTDEKPVEVSKLLEATGGPWLLGLSSQLAAQAVLPAMEEMRDTYVEQLVQTLRSRQTSMNLSLPSELQAALAEQAAKLKKNGSLLQLRKSSMLQGIMGRMAHLKKEICKPLARLGQRCQQDCIDQTGHIKIQWGARIADTTIRNLSKSLGKVTQVPKTAAYRTTFAHAGILAGMDDVLQAVEEEVATCLTAFAKEHVFADIVTSVAECLEAGVPQPEHTLLQQFVHQVADSCVMPSLDGLVKRFVRRLLHPAQLKAGLRDIQAKCVGTHLLRGPLAAASMEACRTELLGRVDNTVNAAQAGMPRVFDDHVHQQIQGFIGFLTRDGSRYRGGVERFTKTLVKEIPMHCRASPQADDSDREQTLYEDAVSLQQQIQRDINAMKAQAMTPMMANGGLAASLHRAAKLTIQLEQHPDLTLLMTTQNSAATSQTVVPEEFWLNLSTNWAECSALNLQGSFTKRVQHQLQSHKGLGPPSLSDSDWQQIAHNSLPAALQHLMWPANGALSPQAQMAERQHIWQGIRVVVAHTLIGIWDDLPEGGVQQVAAGIEAAAVTGVELEQQMERILKPGHPLGLLELLAFMTSGAINQASGQELCVQLWTPGQDKPVVLFSPPSEESGSAGGSRRSFAYNLLALTLPASQAVVWLPLVKTGYTDVSGHWEQRLHQLDQQVVAARASRTPTSSKSSDAPAQPAGLRARLQTAAPQRCMPKDGRATRKRRRYA